MSKFYQQVKLFYNSVDDCLFVNRTTVSRVLNDNLFFLVYVRDAVLSQDLAFGLNEQNKRNIKGEQSNYQLQLQNTLKNAYIKKLVDRKKEKQNK